MTATPSGGTAPEPPGRWSDLERPPLGAAALRRGLIRPGGLWTALDVVESTGSTNTDLAERAAAGTAGEGAVLVSEEQTAGRGRLDRHWVAPARSGIFVSVLLRPGVPGTERSAADPVPVTRWGWLPLLAGVAVAAAVSRAADTEIRLKWPNDLLVTVGGEERKAGGILAESVGGGEPAARTGGDAGAAGPAEAGGAAGAGTAAGGTAAPAGVVLGLGLNVSLRAAELPVPGAGSLALAGGGTDRDPLLRAVLRSLELWYGDWRAAGGDPVRSGLLAAYTERCATLGRAVRAVLPGDREVTGEAVALDEDGRLVLETAEGRRAVGAGDVVHLRPRG
ncbi:biotin--[acetyl-CoA-carboxylase] ligase [Streptomyces zingiberis]|uniref:biotin--[biotin carboxyl-carrier protein] ligase n=1 Tax=Streptomyces zingiberis TaxID=2053010 RepID=A0ABX1BYL7_9ACTN|nr:biotin--[acetyl-CoA-carboxylase] ligase [Streptomyces zingiberis]NJQ00597.1 biotin--[acetyl-CoA-carboxylase] ligase [Streptomyces zingiberis]